MIFDAFRWLRGAGSGPGWKFRPKRRGITMRPGLFDVPGLETPTAFRGLVEDAIGRCRSLIDLLPLVKHSTESLRLLDQISDECCRVIDVSELIRHVHPQEVWRKESQLAHEKMSSFMTELNVNPEIYHTINGLRKTSFRFLNSEQRQMVSTLLLDMQHSGIECCPETRAHLARLYSQTASLETQFYVNILNPCFETTVTVSKQHLPSFILKLLPQTHDAFILLSPSNSDILLGNCTDAPTRKKIYMQVNSQAKPNLTILDLLVRKRKDYSKTLGFQSYADLRLSGMIMKNSDEVVEFLSEISARLRSKAHSEMQLLQYARNYSRNPLDAWDVLFYCNHIRRQNGLGLAQIRLFPLGYYQGLTS